ncbi:hypothetical protein L3V82_02340 [Thiotrichales bacterium 19S3-7]|nr:hypothetical protein [Thiotrichales bacterium 19S3-7]MCF6801006.1 hypothetical protein [Thiotrichales bacterium 19S3-11]
MQKLLLYPVFILVIFTLISLFISIFSKVQAIRDGSLPLADLNQLEYQRSESESHHAKTTAYHFQDLCRLPVLFYLTTIILIYLHIEDYLFLILSWLYVGATLVHSLVYLTYNRFMPRLSAFLIANSFLTVFVILTLIEMIKQ